MADNLFLSEFSQVEEDAPYMRSKCQRCTRPASVCICPFMPKEVLQLKQTRIFILQHPNEEKRPLRTTTILEACLPKDRCYIMKDRRFSRAKFPELYRALDEENTFLLYPGKDAVTMSETMCMGISESNQCNIIILDGTWHQASSIYTQNSALHTLKKIVINVTSCSEYVIRTQPDKKCLCTAECAAISLAFFEKNQLIQEMLLKPLRALCRYQLDHGSQIHHSKESKKYQQKFKE